GSPRGGIRGSGYNGHGQPGNSRRTSQGTPPAVPGVQKAVSVTAGGLHTCATLQDGTATCWGANFDGNLGDGTLTSRGHAAAVVSLTGVQMLASGFAHSCALTGGAIECWGRDDHGELGDATTYTRSYPLAVPGLSAIDQIAAGVGGNTSCARFGGAVSCWGQGGNGQLGNGDTSNSDIPVSVK